MDPLRSLFVDMFSPPRKKALEESNSKALQHINGHSSSKGKMPGKTRKKVAIVGSGCAGLGAAWALKDTDYEVHIFEQANRFGGHTNTQSWRRGQDSVQVDTGFIVMNSATYPNFMNFLKDVGIETKPTEMSFGVCRDQGKFEWSGSLQGAYTDGRKAP